MSLPISPGTPWLAPLAGFSDLPFRLLCREHGCAVAVTEMISAKGLIYNSPGTQDLLRTTPADAPLVVQIFGAEEYFLLQAVERLQAQGFTHFDLNCGCSVRKVVKTGSGAALLTDLPLLLHLARALIQATGPGRMGFKIRLGWKDHVYLTLARELEHIGAAWITLHPRTGVQGFTGQADWSHLARLKQAVGLPVMASGDLFQPEDGLQCLDRTNVDGLMFARGALADPTIFHRYLSLLRGQGPVLLSGREITALVRRLCVLYQKHDLAKPGLLKMRTLVPRFLKGLPGARALRREMVTCSSWEQVLTLLERNEHEEYMP